MAGATTSWLHYYQKALADGAKGKPDPRQLERAIGLDREAIETGRLPVDVAKRLRELAGQQKSTNARGSMAARQIDREGGDIEILVFPWVLTSRREHGQKRDNWRETFVPVVIRAWLMSDGGLRPHEAPPWIPRDRLQPVEEDHFVLGELSRADEFLAERGYAPQAWPEVLEYARQLIERVAGRGVEAMGGEGYALMIEARAMVSEEGDERMIKSILLLYQRMAVNAPASAVHGLLRHAGERPGAWQKTPPSGTLQSSGMWATVSSRYPLAASQRLALASLNAMPDQEVLAIQGPPGTGKTTLLKSVVAQLWVEAAVNARPCPIIAACSANNQAVTNIIDAFIQEVGDGEDAWQRRWLPEVRSLGLYAASASRTAQGGKNYQELASDGKAGWTGFFQEIENTGWLGRAETLFLAEARAALDTEKLSVSIARTELLARLKRTAADITALLSAWRAVADATKEAPAELTLLVVGERHGESLCADEQQAQESVADAVARVELIKACACAWDKHIAGEPWWQTLFSWIPAVRVRRDAGRRQVLQSYAELEVDWTDWDAEIVRAKLEASGMEARMQQATVAETARQAKRARNEWEERFNQLRAGLDRLWDEAQQTISKETLRDYAGEPAVLWRREGRALDDVLDLTWRVRAFRLAMHYWEADYLTELREKLDENPVADTNQPEVREREFRRWAKVAPCLVSTFYMLPKFFTTWPRGPRPLFGVLDLLICDEAGQVSPEMAVASFGLARRALVVGDVYQIEPVWNVSFGVDAANAAACDLVPKETAARDWRASGRQDVSASRGNLMALAQQATLVRQCVGTGGLFLCEHRRCVPEIIAYCNDAVYEGGLMPMRSGLPGKQRTLPPLGYANLPFSAREIGSGRCNLGEAKLIVAWLAQRQTELEHHYSEREKNQVRLGEIAAVITPFRAQKEALLAELVKVIGKNHGVTAGTVHALQGAERPVVIFSPVYDASHRGGYFFEKGSDNSTDQKKRFQLFNVAVSRAKDSFLVFGCLDAFRPARGDKPAAVLGRYLFGEHGQEITDLPWEAGREAQAAASSLRGTDAHDQLLRAAIAEARRTMTISSPFLTKQGVEARGVLPQLAEAVRKGVNVEVFVDRELTKDRTTFEEAMAMLSAAGVRVRVSRPDRGVHAKTLAVDGCLLVEGSFNWFSAVAEGGPYHRYEASMVYRGENVGRMIEEALESLRQRVDMRVA